MSAEDSRQELIKSFVEFGLVSRDLAAHWVKEMTDEQVGEELKLRASLHKLRKETEQRDALQRRLGARTAPHDRSDMGIPMLNEDL